MTRETETILSAATAMPETGARQSQAAAPQPGALRQYVGQLARNPLGLLGLTLVVIIVVSAIFAPWIVPYQPDQIFVGPRLGSPSWAHWLGTDQLGRDTLSRVIAGSRTAMLVAATTLSAALTFGLALGLIAGSGPRWLDQALLLVFDAIRSFPVIIFGLALITLLGPSLYTVILVIAITSVPIYARIVRTQTQSLRAAEFILAERAMGASIGRILVVHIMPNVIGPLLILVSMDVPLVIAVEAGLSFLGMGVRPPTPSWGVILNEGYSYIRNSPWLAIGGSIPIILVTLGFTFLGEALRDIFDPKLKRDL